MKRLLICAALAAALSGCTAADNAYTFNYGNPGRVTCYAVAGPWFDDYSTGKVSKHDTSDGFYFVSQTTNRLTEVTGNCVIDYGAEMPAGFKAVR
jgi:hypothetical protein